MEIYGHNIAFNCDINMYMLDKYKLKHSSNLVGDARRYYRDMYMSYEYVFEYFARFRFSTIDYDEMRDLFGYALPWDEQLIVPFREYRLWADLTDDEIEGMVG